MDTNQQPPPPATGGGSGAPDSSCGGGLDGKSTTLEDVFCSNSNDDQSISALVSSLENSIEASMLSCTNENDNNSAPNTDSSEVNNFQQSTVQNSTPNNIKNINSNMSNHNNPSENSIMNLSSSDGGKRIFVAANSQPVNSSISNMTQTPMMRMSPLTNGTMTPPHSPSVTQTALQQQHTIPVGQQVALVASQQQPHVINSSSMATASNPIRTTTPTPPQTSAISTSFVMTPNQNSKMTTTVGQKSNPTLLTIQSNGQPPPPPMLIGQQVPPSPLNNLSIRPANVQITNSQVTLPNSISVNQAPNLIGPPGSNIVIDPRAQPQQQIQLQQLGVSNASGSNVQFQIVNVNSPSRPSLTVPTASVSAAGYTVSNIITGTNASIQAQSNKSPLAPRLVQLPPNVRLSGVRGNPPGFPAPLGLPNLVRGQTILLKTENGQVHMVNVGPQPLGPAGQSPAQPPTIRLQVPTSSASPMVSAVGSPAAPTAANAAIRTQLAGNQIVLPVSLGASPVNNTPVVAPAIQANKTPVAGAAALSPHQPISVHTTAANNQAASAAPSQMSPTTAKKKCKNFLSTLIRLASDQPETVASNVKTLIQGLIDDTIQPEDFTNQLQRELNSSPQPCLVPFLKKSLPYLRYSLMKEELTIDGVRPPPSNSMPIPSNHQMHQAPSHISNMGSVQVPCRPPMAPGVRLLAPPGPQMASNLIPGAQILSSLPPNNASMGPLVFSSVNTSNLSQPNLVSSVGTTITPTNTTSLPVPQSTPSPQKHQPPSSQSKSSSETKSKSKSSSKSKAKEKAKKEKAQAAAAAVAAEPSVTSTATPHGTGERTTSSFRDDDDINDVAAMGGVNLVEESQRILAGNAEIIGQQIRSCKDEPFLYASPLHQKLNKIVKRYDLEDCSQDVVALVSHAIEERLKTLVEKLGLYAEHRQEQLRTNPNYEMVQDVKGQAQYLQELDRIEKRRHEEQEREVLLRAAKSRSKVDDPDHIAIKARAKEMQRLEMEEIRQREANETALQAIGNPKKRLKTTAGPSAGPGGMSFNSNSNISTSGTTNLFSSYVSKPIKRIKRVTMKDVLFLMELDHTSVRSTMLYKTYAR